MKKAISAWAMRLAAQEPVITRIGYFGSYARGDWGVGSDLDVVIIVNNDTGTISGVSLDQASIPVPVDTLIYSEHEWQELIRRGGKFIREIQAEAVWVFNR